MKILFTSPIIEHPAAGGPQLRIENSIKALSKTSDLYVVSRSTIEDSGGYKAVDYYKSLVKEFSLAPSVKGLSTNKYIKKLQNAYRKLILSRIKIDALYIVKIAKENKIDIVWFGFGNISFDLIKLIKELNPNLKLVCDTDSVWSRFVLRELPYEKNLKRVAKIKADGEEKEKEEAAWVDLCDVTTAVSEIDAEYYRELATDESKVMLFSNVIDVESYHELSAKPKGHISPNIYLAGSFGPKSAMDKAARWFIEEIYPIVKLEVPNVHFYIIGRGSKETLFDIVDTSISILGKVPSVLPYLSHANVSLVPLRFESGTRFKIMEAAACKIPIVSTFLGAEGIPVTDKVDILLSDDVNGFANAIIKLIKDASLSKKISENCYDLIVENNSIDTLVREAKIIIERLNND